MGWLNLRSEYSFKHAYGHLDSLAKKCSTMANYGGIADVGNTFGFVRWKSACESIGIKPVYGVRLHVVDDLELKERKMPYNTMTFIARTTEGVKTLYQMTDVAHQQFYYRPRVSYEQVNKLSDDVYVLSGVAPRWDLLTRKVFQEVGPHIPYSERSEKNERSLIATVDNFYPDADDLSVYEPFADERQLERKSHPIHILTRNEWIADFPRYGEALRNLDAVADSCNAELPTAPMVKYTGRDDIYKWCQDGARLRGLNIDSGEYADRYKREIKLIVEKEYSDYFLVVADLIRHAKKHMSVGHGRGSSGGSLVCYLMGITEVDPIKYGLYFERFIDINRFGDLPDIDIDFQDDKRHLAIRYLENKYGSKHVAQIGNINRLKPKSAINRFAKALSIPLDDLEELKESIVEHSDGDARAKNCIEDTFNETEVGKKFIEKYPSMRVTERVEGHSLHQSVHAAGILVCNKPITDYAGVNSRENKRIAMIDKKDAEKINLLKIDALGLRTLTILADVCDQIYKPYKWLYEIPLDDGKTYDVFNNQRYNGIFQFEGSAVNGLAKQMLIENIEDISALTALGRPGPLGSGGAQTYVRQRSGEGLEQYINDHPIIVETTKNTCGVVTYQEQVMKIVRELGKLSWEDTSKIRKAMSKSLGSELFDKMYPKFEEGAVENGLSKEESKEVWDHLNTMGKYSFNRSHSVAYAIISYLCAYMKAHHPLEFTVACLNHSKDDQSSVRILRDAVENDGIEYCFFDRELSVQDWSIRNGKLYGGLKTIDGIGPQKANQIVKYREDGYTFTKGLQSKMDNPISPFKYLYPAKQVYGDYYTDPGSHGLLRTVTEIKDTVKDDNYTIIGCMTSKRIRDANEDVFLTKRNGVYETGNTTWLNIIIEDDSGEIMCKIKREDYNLFGKVIADTGKENKDWYIVNGDRINGWGLIFVKNIMRITRSQGV